MAIHRKLRLVLLLVAFAFSSTLGSAGVPGSVPPRRPVVVVLGDSTTQYGGCAQGWEVLLHAAYLRSADTINRGLSGYNTRHFLKYAMSGITEEMRNYYSPTVIIIWFGVNDATLKDGPNYKQHISLDEYRANLITIITQLRAVAPDAKILLLSPGYIDENQRLRAMLSQGRRAGDPLDRNNAETEKYAAVCKEVSAAVEREDVAFLDVYAHFVENYPSDDQRARLLRDGLHFSADGDRVFAELLKKKIDSIIPRSVLHTYQFPTDMEIERLERQW